MRRGLRAVGGGVCIALAALLISLTPFARAVDRPLEDAMLRAAQGSPPALPRGRPDVSVVAIDPRSLRAFPGWPWPRERYAEAANALMAAGAAAIAFDVDFSTAREPAGDAAFADAIRASGRVALAALRQRQELPGVGELEVVSRPIEVLMSAGARAGHVVVPVESDGVVRRTQGENDLGAERVPSLPGLALELAGFARPRALHGPHRIDFRRASPEIPVLSIADVLERRFDPREVDGRVILVGATAAEFQDLWTTPLGPARPGVWVQAVEYRTLAAASRGERTLAAAPKLALFAACLALALAGGALAESRPGLRAGGFAALGLASALASFGGLVQMGALLSPALPVAQLAIHYVAGVERVRRRLGLRLEERELSLAALYEVGESATRTESESGLETGLVLLGRIAGAHAVALLRADTAGELDGTRVDWRPHGQLAAVDSSTAAEVLRQGTLRVFDGEIPGRPGVRGRAVYVALVAGRLPVGVLVVEGRKERRFGDTELRTIATVASQLALSVRSLRLTEELRGTLGASVEAIASAVEARDGYTELHCRRLALFCVSMAKRLGLTGEEIEAIRLGALLHDVGKIGVPDHVLLKPGRFTPDERRDMERHAEVGHRIVRPISGLAQTTLACVRSHHERWDGMGYPDGLRGAEIPLPARIVAIVDVWDALSSARPYKPAYPQERVRELLRKSRGTHFDPDLLDLFLRVLDEEGDEMLEILEASGVGPA